MRFLTIFLTQDVQTASKSIVDAAGSVTIAKDIVQIAFFLTIATITILSYIAARKTVLQPIKTEIFKKQLDILTEILTIFSGKSEFELQKFLGYGDLIGANVSKLMDHFVAAFFDIEADIEERPYNPKNCPTGEFVRSASSLLFHRIESPVIPDPPREVNGSLTAETWSKYEFVIVSIPRTFHEMELVLRKLAASPLLPKKCVQLINEFNDLNSENIQTLGEVLTECAKELPDHYPDRESLIDFQDHWIENKFIDRCNDLEEKANEITNYVRKYFSTDDLLA